MGLVGALSACYVRLWRRATLSLRLAAHFSILFSRMILERIMDENGQTLEQTQTSKRNFIALGVRNVLAIGVLATSAAVAGIGPASAMGRVPPSGGGGGSGNCFLRGT